MKINKKFLDEITKRLDIVSASGRSTIEQIMLSAPQGFNFNELYEYVCEQYLPISQTCAENAAVVGASAYDTYREIELGEVMNAMPYTNYSTEETASALRSFVGRACDLQDMSFLVDMLGRRLDAEVMRSYTDSQLINGENDPRKPKFARVPSGPSPCDFCRALAGHGFFYSSRETAGDEGSGFNRFHDFCRCQVVPEFSDMAKRLEVAGYDPQIFVDEWRRSGKEFGTNRSSNNRGRMINPTKSKTAMPKIDKPLLKEAPAPVKLPDKCFDGEWDQADDMLKFLNALFNDDECVGTCTEFFDKGGRRVPTRGLFQRTAGQIKKVLGRTNNVSSAVGRYRRSDGAFVRINPLDGKGVSDANVTAFRYALIECDNLPLEEQYAFIRALNLPTQAIVTSGGKSVHAVVRIDAKDIEEYKERVALLHAECKAAGFDVDASTKNPSRFMRLPGIRRGKKRQALVSTGEGAESWDDWRAWCDESRKEQVSGSSVNAIKKNSTRGMQNDTIKSYKTFEKMNLQFFASKEKQYGKKIGKHARDFDLDPSNESHRQKMMEIINDICENAEIIKIGPWKGQSEEVLFKIKGNDVVITKQDGEFISILKDGAINNARIKNARIKKV